MKKKLENGGFYWARRRDGGKLTIVEVWGDALMFIGNLQCPDIEEAEAEIEILGPVEPYRPS